MEECYSAKNLREFEPLVKILQLLPTKVHKAFYTLDLDWTCLDVTAEYIAIGSDFGIVYLIDKSSEKLQKLICKDIKGKHIAISKIKMCHNVDYMVAVGASNGQLFIFQLPSILPGRSKQLQLYEVSDLHHSEITSIVWSQNGQKVFSGDSDGIIYCTEFEYSQEFHAKSSSYFVMKEPNEIVQLDYAAKILLVSTRWRTMLYFTGKKEVIQVGRKDRKSLGQFGAIFHPVRAYGRPEDIGLFAARPGQRIWTALADGTVEATYIFKDLITKSSEGMFLLEDTVNLFDVQPTKTEDLQFGPLLIYKETNIITFNESSLFVLDPENGSFVAYHTHLGPIVDVAIYKDEIYVLRNGAGRKLIRIAETPYISTGSPVAEYKKTVFTSDGTLNMENMLGAFKEVGEKIHGAVEGLPVLKSADQIPPWGYVDDSKNKGEEINNVSKDISPVDSAKEAGSSTATTPESPNKECPSVLIACKYMSMTEKKTTYDEETSEFTGSGIFRESAPGGPVWEEPLHVHHPGAPPLTVVLDDGNKNNGNDVKDIKYSRPKDIAQVELWNSVAHEDEGEYTSDIVFASVKPKKKVKKKAREKDNQCLPVPITDPQHSLSSLTASEVKSSTATIGREKKASSIHQDYESEQKVQQLSTNINQEAKNDCIQENNENIFDNYSDSLEIDNCKSEEEVEKTRQLLESRLTALPRLESVIEDVENDSVLNATQPLLKGLDQNSNQFGSQSHKNDSVDNNTERYVTDNQNTLVLKSDSSKLVLKSDIGSDNIKPLIFDKVNHSIERTTESDIKLNEDLPESLDSCNKQLFSNESDTFDKFDEHVPADEKISEKFESEISSVKHVETKPPLTTNNTNSKKINTSKSFDSAEDIYSKYGPVRSSSNDMSLSSSSSSISPSHRKVSESEYDIYRTSMVSNRSMTESECDERSIEDMLNEEQVEEGEIKSDVFVAEGGALKEVEEISEVIHGRFARPAGFIDSWTEFLTGGNLQCICVTQRHVWVVDKSDRISWSFLSGPGIKWHKLEIPAQHISVSPSGSIVWRLHNGALYAGTKITTRAPAGLKWEDFVQKDVVNMSVDDHMGWYVKSNGEIIMHKKLSRDRPCFKPIKIGCDQHLVQVICKNNVVWALTSDRCILVRNGVKEGEEEGTSWTVLECGLRMLVSHCDLGEDDTGWVIDVVGRVWFTTGVTSKTPQGSGQWWQVSMAEYLMQESTAFDTIKNLAANPSSLVRLMKQEDKGGLISSRCNGIWVVPGYKNTIHICRGSMVGHRWEHFDLPGMASSVMKWVHISARAIQEKIGLMWIQQPNGDLFCFNPYTTRHNSSIKVIEVPPPEPGCGQPFKCLCVLSSVVWVLMPNGKIYVRTDIRAGCPQGLNWVHLNMQQLGNAKILWLSAGSQNLWTLDSTGKIYLRIGTEPPSTGLLNPAWVPVEGTPHMLGARFTQVHAGPCDWMVWALDSFGNVYARKGITDSMPIGTHWVYVKGPKGESLCVGEQHVYALTQRREIVVRGGITKKNLCGDNWNKIPGSLFSISVPNVGEDIWGIDKDGRICQRFTHYLKRIEVLEHLQSTTERGDEVEEGWELL